MKYVDYESYKFIRDNFPAKEGETVEEYFKRLKEQRK